jgi:hypothetical protein
MICDDCVEDGNFLVIFLWFCKLQGMGRLKYLKIIFAKILSFQIKNHK